MNPITKIEILIAVGIVIGLIILVFILLRKYRRLGLFIVLFVALAELVFFAVRPIWINYHVAIKTEQLHGYLEKNTRARNGRLAGEPAANTIPII